MREKIGKRWTKWYTDQERYDLTTSYPRIPSPRGEDYWEYIQHRMKMLPNGIAAYATRQYARLSLDKYIQTNRECDEIAVNITQNQPSAVYIGAAELHPNRPIGIKKQKRCPGTRKLLTSIKKLGHSVVIFVDEYFTSQTCANCFGRFPRATRQNRFKVCRGCNPTDPSARLPTGIVTQHSKRQLQAQRRHVKNVLKNHIDQVHFEDHHLFEGVEKTVKRFQELYHRLVSKVSIYRKNWQPIAANHGLNDNAANIELQTDQQQQRRRGRTVVWHRDIVAARCILYKGTCI